MRGFAFIGIEMNNVERDISGIVDLMKKYKADVLILNSDSEEVNSDICKNKDVKDIPILKTNNMFAGMPFSCVPVIVKNDDSSTLISEYNHPERAFYIFCDEDQDMESLVPLWLRDHIHFENMKGVNITQKLELILKDRYEKTLIKETQDIDQKEIDRKPRRLYY